MKNEICITLLLFYIISTATALKNHSRGICDGIDYKLLNDSSRNVEYDGNEVYTDNSLSESKSPDWDGPGWYRMIEPAGLQLPEKKILGVSM